MGERRALLTLILSTALFWGGLYIFVPVLAPQAHRLGAGVAAVGMVLGAYGLAGLLFRMPFGLISDHVGRRKPFVVLAMALAAASALGMASARTPGTLALFRFLSGIAASGWVTITVLTAESFRDEGTLWALGMVNAAAGSGQVLVMPLGGWLAAAGDFRRPFAFGAVLALLGAALALGLRETGAGRPQRTPALAGLRAAARSPALRRVSLVGALMQFVVYVTIYGFVPLVARIEFHASGLQLGLLSFGLFVPLVLAPLVSSRLAQRWSSVRLVQACMGTAALGAAAVPFAAGLDGLALAGGVTSVGVGLAIPVLMSMALDTAPPRLRGAAMGLYQTLYTAGSFSGPVLAGMVGEVAGLRAMFLASAGVALVAAIAAGRLPTPPRSSRRGPPGTA